MKNENLFELAKGGVYSICCLKNNKTYIGSTASFLERAARHWTLLKSNNHECLALQNDFNKYGRNFFDFKIIVLENNFKKRLSSFNQKNNLYKKILPGDGLFYEDQQKTIKFIIMLTALYLGKINLYQGKNF